MFKSLPGAGFPGGVARSCCPEVFPGAVARGCCPGLADREVFLGGIPGCVAQRLPGKKARSDVEVSK